MNEEKSVKRVTVTEEAGAGAAAAGRAATEAAEAVKKAAASGIAGAMAAVAGYSVPQSSKTRSIGAPTLGHAAALAQGNEVLTGMPVSLKPNEVALGQVNMPGLGAGTLVMGFPLREGEE